MDIPPIVAEVPPVPVIATGKKQPSGKSSKAKENRKSASNTSSATTTPSNGAAAVAPEGGSMLMSPESVRSCVSPGGNQYPRVNLDRHRIVDGTAAKKTDEALARDILRGGGVLVPGERIDVWYDSKLSLKEQGIEEPQQTLPFAAAGAAAATDPSATQSTGEPSSAAPVSTGKGGKGGKKPEPVPSKGKSGSSAAVPTRPPSWIRGTIVSSNKARYTVTVELDIPLAGASASSAGKGGNKAVKSVVVFTKQARWKLVEFVSPKYVGLLYQPRPDQKPSAPAQLVAGAAFRCEPVFSDRDCASIELVETKKEFLRQRKVDPFVKQAYSFQYSVPKHEQAEMDELKRLEREGVAALGKEVGVKSAEINARVEAELVSLEAAREKDMSPLEASYEQKKRDIDFERDEKTAGLEAMEGRTSGTGMSLRVQKKMIDDNHRNRWLKEVVPLEKQLGDMQGKFDRERRRIEAAGREEVALLVKKKDDYAAALKARQQVLRDRWKKMSESDIQCMRTSLNIRVEKEWVLARRALIDYMQSTRGAATGATAALSRGLEFPCNVCGAKDAGFACQQNKCDSCWKFSIFEPKIEELELRVPWANNRTSADFTAYHVYFHDRSREIRNERPNTEPALISQTAKEEWKRMKEEGKIEYEIKRQQLLLELLDHVEEEEEEVVDDRKGPGEDNPVLGGKKRGLDETVARVLEDSDAESDSDEACTKCLSLKHAGKLLQCDRTEGESIDDDRVCGGMLHTFCCSPPLAGVPEGKWYCSYLCEWVESHKRAANGRRSPTRKSNAARLNKVGATVLVDDDGVDDEPGAAAPGAKRAPIDVAIARRNRYEFLLSQWGVIECFLGDHSEKAQQGIQAKLDALNVQLGDVDTDSIKLGPKILDSGVPFPIDASPSFVQADMRPYQLEGLTWFIEQHDKGANSIMGDEMGLGKTLQTLSFLATLHKYVPFFTPSLVVAPLSVLPNWIAEAKKWTPQLTVVGLFGPMSERERVKASMAAAAKNGDPPHVVVTTYEILLAEITWLRSQFYFRYFILDEAQKIKNTDALVTQACRQIRSVYRVLLTGTPLQNNMKELWALLNFLYPEVFTLQHTAGRFASAYDSSTTSDDTSGTMIKDDSLMKQCCRVLEPIMLRRLKQNVLAALLPPKTEIVLTAPMSQVQQHHYRQVLKTVTGLVRNVGYKNVSSLLWQLWKCCLHPYLFDGEEEAASVGEGHEVDAKIVTMSGKMCLLDSLLTKLFDQRSKCLVYSQYTSMLDIIEEYCQWRGWRYLRLDGSTSLARRRFYMHLFNQPWSASGEKDYFVFLVSTKAGGVGVNLQAANSVVLYDSSWNPFVDAQAEDRAHRMGQKKEVTIYRLITKDTCEERIRYFAQQKLKMKQFVLNEDESGEKSVVDAGEFLGDEAADVSKIYSTDQLKDIIEFGAANMLSEESGDGGDRYSTSVGDAFYKSCCDSLEFQLEQAAKVKEQAALLKLTGKAAGSGTVKAAEKPHLSPVKRNICIRKFGQEDYTQTKVERTTEMDWLDVMEEERIVQRNRKATTVTIDTHERGLGKIQVSKWSLDQEQKEREMMERDRARIDAKKIGGNKRVTEHDMNCLHCRDSVLKQKVIVTTETDENGNEVKKRRIDTDSSGFQSCPICPATLHLNCTRLAVHGQDVTVRSNCPQHKCRICRRSASNAGGLLFRCTECPIALCYDCIEKYELIDNFEFIERENVRWERDLGFTAASTYEYMKCPDCTHKLRLVDSGEKMEIDEVVPVILPKQEELK